jgi:hypothetical protein
MTGLRGKAAQEAALQLAKAEGFTKGLNEGKKIGRETARHLAVERVSTAHTTDSARPVQAPTNDSAFAEGARSERKRICAILDCDEGKAKPKAAMALALRSSLSLEQAVTLIADIPEETPLAAEKRRNLLDEAMRLTGGGARAGGDFAGSSPSAGQTNTVEHALAVAKAAGLDGIHFDRTT